MAFDYDKAQNSYVLRLIRKTSGKSNVTDKFLISFSDADGAVRISMDGAYDNNSQLAFNALSKLQELIGLLTSSDVKYTTESDCGPKSMVLDVNGGSLPISVY